MRGKLGRGGGGRSGAERGGGGGAGGDRAGPARKGLIESCGRRKGEGWEEGRKRCSGKVLAGMRFGVLFNGGFGWLGAVYEEEVYG